MRDTSKKTPKDATEFEREQLRFFMTKSDAAALLAEMNPSLAWLPILSELKLIDNGTQLAPWIEKNFAEVDAIREVATNIHFFGPDVADILELRLNQMEELPTVLMTCWRLIIRHMRAARRGAFRDGWFDIAPRIKRGEQSHELLTQLANTLKPKLRVGKRFSWRDTEGAIKVDRPTDIISIDYEIEDHITEDIVLSAWPENTSAEVDDKLLGLLTHDLSAAIEDAIEAGVEEYAGYSLSDMDVPSVAKHKQNAYRNGFLPIVRVMADLWTRLVTKDSARALSFVTEWQKSQFKLFRRLVAFAVANPAMPAKMAAQVLLSLPSIEIFLTNSSVEVYRLIDARWRDFSAKNRKAIELRFIEGPPADSFRADQEESVDRCKFDILGHLERVGMPLGQDAKATLDGIRNRHPNWGLRPKEQAGFHIWSESSWGAIGDPAKLKDVSDEQLIPAAKKIADNASFGGGDAWQALCQTDTPRALHGLAAQADNGVWPAWAWHSFLWTPPKLNNEEDIAYIAKLLLKWPEGSFHEVASAASWWLQESSMTLDDNLLWLLWDKITEASMQEAEESHDKDALNASLNHPSGRLTGIILKKLALSRGPDDNKFLEPIYIRLNKAISATGNFGKLAKVRLAAEVSFLFARIPEWSEEKIIPLFDWLSPDAAAAWSARKYANYIGSPELIGLTKKPFLELFGRTDIPDEELRVFAEWLAMIMIANQIDQMNYPITPAECRSALRQGGVKCLSSVGYRLGIEMEAAKPEEKLSKWHDVVGPVFQSIWPLDIELQTSSSTFSLVRLLLASGAAFPEAAEIIIPFIRPDGNRDHTSLFSISEVDDALYLSSPEKMLDLIVAVVGEVPSQYIYGLSKALEKVRRHAPQLANTKQFQKLLGIASNS